MSSFEELERIYSEMQKWKAAETELSNAYLRLRRLIPGALDTPTAPTRNQVWAVTEEALKRLVARQGLPQQFGCPRCGWEGDGIRDGRCLMKDGPQSGCPRIGVAYTSQATSDGVQ